MSRRRSGHHLITHHLSMWGKQPEACTKGGTLGELQGSIGELTYPKTPYPPPWRTRRSCFPPAPHPVFHTALSRQIAEACRVQKWGEYIVLNSKDEFNRSKIRRLMIGEDKKTEPKNIDKEEEENTAENREYFQGTRMGK